MPNYRVVNKPTPGLEIVPAVGVARKFLEPVKFDPQIRQKHRDQMIANQMKTRRTP